FGSLAICGGREKVSSRIDWTVESCGTGIQTRSFFVPAGTSSTLPVYSMEKLRVSPGRKYSGLTVCCLSVCVSANDKEVMAGQPAMNAARASLLLFISVMSLFCVTG